MAPDYPQWALTATDINNKGQVVGGNTNGMWGPRRFSTNQGRSSPSARWAGSAS